MIENLNQETFKKKIFDFSTNKDWEFAGEIPAIIDFYADWCGPCKMVAPILEELAKEYKGKVNFFKIDTEQEQELAGVFGVSSIPALLFIPQTDKPQMNVGALPKENLKKAIAEVLKVTL